MVWEMAILVSYHPVHQQLDLASETKMMLSLCHWTNLSDNFFCPLAVGLDEKKVLENCYQQSHAKYQQLVPLNLCLCFCL